MSLEERVRKVVPEQADHHFVGTLKSQAQRGVFYFSMYNFSQILFISFQNGAYGDWFGSFPVYLAMHALGFGAIVALDYKFVLPGEKDYQKRQDYLRDPIRQDIHELHEEVERLREEQDDD